MQYSIQKGGDKMAVSSKIKALLNLKNQEQVKLAQHLGISKQALSNKFYRDSFSAEDLIKIADFLRCDLAFNVDNKLHIILDCGDLKDKNLVEMKTEIARDLGCPPKSKQDRVRGTKSVQMV